MNSKFNEVVLIRVSAKSEQNPKLRPTTQTENSTSLVSASVQFSKASITISRDAACTTPEWAHLARALLHAQQNPTQVVDQTTACVYQKLSDSFSATSPSDAEDTCCKTRGIRPARERMEQVAAVLPKLGWALL